MDNEDEEEECLNHNHPCGIDKNDLLSGVFDSITKVVEQDSSTGDDFDLDFINK